VKHFDGQLDSLAAGYAKREKATAETDVSRSIDRIFIHEVPKNDTTQVSMVTRGPNGDG
jgi:hypothetical protein